jgi:hypothetical protein
MDGCLWTEGPCPGWLATADEIVSSITLG